MSEQIVIDISPAGSVKIDAQGFKGQACSVASKQIEIVLGGHGQTSKKKKPEFFQPAATGQKVKRTF